MSELDQGAAFSISSGRPLWQRIVCGWLARIKRGQLRAEFPCGAVHLVKGDVPGPTAAIVFMNSRAVWRMLTSGSLGFARSYLDGDWETPDLGTLMDLALANEETLKPALASRPLISRLAYLRHLFRRNSRAGSRRNIAFHYDLGNDFYRAWLDETMTYSAAIFERQGQSLGEAQQAKYDRILSELRIGPQDHVLEIGCGWGGFMEYAASRTGCRITGLTLSKEQADFARARLANKGLSPLAEVRLQDYRDCEGRFTKIVSIEMFEAVGEENWPVYFEKLRTNLAPDGQALIQVITIDERRYERYRQNADFIQTYVFPGGMLPSAAVFRQEAVTSGLRVRDAFSFGRDYEKTLLLWEGAFLKSWHKIESAAFDERFKRLWRYYLHYCAAGFRNGTIDVYQFRLEPT
ncbi:cyclopropane-fatty-acyl-phospholipid synthase family protein [Ensifer sp. ENS01]|uniref:SAM-dependent methyltransferase n=1 Tax=Ensifer sp. ENS01 TaxID=2769293 RepID=UPI001783671E|nr:cyclopropane-fatty-acyl-phospholipid synthase family protein [Ensifer sp. ENS01]MBD9498746.1 class I SAM-dependent methyltransferase [Ensifer sp. ENS01]